MAVKQAVTFLHGGFAKVGGIETFTTDLVLALNARHVEPEVICWSGRGKDENPALRKLADNGVKISRSDWKWGCRWGLPDRVLVTQQRRRIADAEFLVFGKLLHSSAHRLIMPLKKRMTLITPYRPAEMWKDESPGPEILNSLESIIVQAHAFEEDLREFGYRGKVIILPLPPPEVLETHPWPASTTLQVGFLGRLVPDKNVEYLIRSFARLREMGVAAHLHIFGDGPERNMLGETASGTGFADRIEFHGHQNRAEIPKAINQCHLFAFTSRTEGLPIGSLEILSRGRPVVGTPVGAFPEFLSGLLGTVAPIDDPKAFAVALAAIAKPILEGKFTPAEVQQAYQSRFPREKVIQEYMRAFGAAI
jgi:glycosyltransferase involved in cell wall biosynthesis